MAEFIPVTFYDSQNNKSITYNMQEGANISTTNKTYTVKPDGLYSNGEKVNSVAVTLPQYTAISLWDADGDKDIDGDDAKIFQAREEQSLTAGDDRMGNDIDNSLSKNGSKYRVLQRGGSHAVAHIDINDTDAYNFYAYFQNTTDEDDYKLISITSQKAGQKIAESEARDARLKATIEDREYAKAHPVRNFFGITREQYERNHTIDY